MPSVSHHYLPQTYLRRFTSRENRKLLWVCDKKTFDIKESTPKDSGCADYYHAFTRKDGTLDTDSIENELGKIETTVDGWYTALRQSKPLTPKEWASFHLFAASLVVRVPAFVKPLQDFSTQIFQQTFELMRSNPKVLKEWEQKGIPVESLQNVEVEAEHSHALALSLDSMETPRQIFSKMSWLFLKAPPKCFFITGDRPVSYHSPSAAKSLFPPGLAMRDIEVIFPLSRSVCAMGAWGEFKELYKEVSPEVAQAANCRVARAAKEFMYGPRNVLSDFCLKEKG